MKKREFRAALDPKGVYKCLSCGYYQDCESDDYWILDNKTGVAYRVCRDCHSKVRNLLYAMEWNFSVDGRVLTIG